MGSGPGYVLAGGLVNAESSGLRAVRAKRLSPAHKRPDKLGGVDTEGVGDLDELDDIESSFPLLVLADKGLRAGQAFGDLHLGQSGFLPCLNQ
jgi:hypothetical protein